VLTGIIRRVELAHTAAILLRQRENKMSVYTVKLADGTVGTVNSDCLGCSIAEDFIGDWMTVQLHNENGEQIEITGILESVLEEN
jgi:hypothetical protein